MGALAVLALAVLAVVAAEVVLRSWRDPRARDLTGDWSQLPEATRRLQPRALRGALRIVVLGDSIPFGWPLATHDGYPTHLQALLQARHPDRAVAVINCGIGGHTSVMGLARVERDLVRWRPHIALIAFGLNDCHLARTPLDDLREQRMYASQGMRGRLRTALRSTALLDTLAGLAKSAVARSRGKRPSLLEEKLPPPEREGAEPIPSPPWGEGRVRGNIPLGGEGVRPRVSPTAYADALRGLVRAARGARAQACLVTMTPLGPPALQGGWRAETYRAYDQILRKVAAEEQALLIDLQAAFPIGPTLGALLASDGVHLTAQGQRVVAQTIGYQLLAISYRSSLLGTP